MPEIACKACQANPPAVAGFCSPCWSDAKAEARAQEKAQERARIEARRRGRPAWRPDYYRGGHGHGTERVR